MFCYKCGKEVKEEMNHCPHCGADLKANSTPEKKSGGSGKPAKPMIAAAVIVAAVLIIAGIFMISGRRLSLNATDYIALTVKGLNTEGTAELSFDADKVIDDVLEKKTLTEREKEVFQVLLQDVVKDFSLSKDSQLSNGEKVTVKSDIDKNLLKEYGVVLKNGSLDVTVEGLLDIQEISVNQYASIAFNGFDGYGYSYMEVDWEGLRKELEDKIRSVADGNEAEAFIASEMDTYLYSLYGEITPNEGLHNGDETSLKFSMENNEISQYGIRFVWEDITASAEGLVPTETIPIGDYLRLDISGFSGAAKAGLTFDTEKLVLDLQERFKKDGRSAYGPVEEDMDLELEAQYAAQIVRDGWGDTFQTQISQESGLKNGDSVTVECTAAEENSYIPMIGIFIEGGTKETAVEGLEEPAEVDLAEAVSVVFSGVCPNVTAEITIDDEKPYVPFTSLSSMDRYQTLQAENGDVFKGEITYDEQELLEMGYLVTNSEYSFTISGLNTYELACDSPDTPSLKKISEEMDPCIKQILLENSVWIVESKTGNSGWILWDESRIALSEVKAAYVSDEYDTYNRLYLLYRADLPIRLSDRSIVREDVYVTLHMYNVEQSEDGDLVYEEPDYYWNSELFLTREEAEANILSDKEEMGDAEFLFELENALEEEPAEEAAADTEVRGEESAAEMPVPGEIEESVRAQAARIIEYEGHTYARYDTPSSWNIARGFCEKAGGHLVTVTSGKEKAIVQKLLEDAPYDRYWLGASDAGWEGSWEWVTGEPFLWTDWADSQPDNAPNDIEEGGEDYLETNNRGDAWNDFYNDTEKICFILETDPVSEPEGEYSYLSDLTQLSARESGISPYLQDPYGNDHFYSVYLNVSESGTAVYDLNGEYSSFTGTLSTWTEADSDCVMEFAVWGDGKLLFSEYYYRKEDAPIPFTLNVEGVRTLSLQTRNLGIGDGAFLFLNEARLTFAETEPAPAARMDSLKDLPLVTSSGYETLTDSGINVDIYGEIHREAYSFQAGGRAVWNLDGDYTSMEGVFYAGRNSYNQNTAVSVEVLLDGETVLNETALDIYQGYIPVDLDLTDKRTLEIRVVSDTESDGSLYLADTLLTRSEPEEAVVETPGPEFPEISEDVVRKASYIVECGNYKYYLFEEPLSWEQAREFCSDAGGTLACPSNSEQTSALIELVKRRLYDRYWIGGSRSDTQWTWDNDEPFGEYLNWRDGQPDNVESREFFICMNQDGTWDDYGASYTTGFIMQTAAISGQLPEDTVSAASLEWLGSDCCEKVNVISSLPDSPVVKVWLDNVRMDASNNAWFSADLKGSYDSLSGRVMAYSGASKNIDLQLAIFGDGKLLYSLDHFRRSDADREFTVDLSGVGKLTVMTSNMGSYDNGFLFLKGDLHEAETPTAPNVSRLSEQISVNGTDYESQDRFFRDPYGKLYDGYLAMNAGRSSRLLYNLAGQYTGFSGTITAGDGTQPDIPSKITILADGTNVYETELSGISGPAEFSVDLSGCSMLEITAESEADDSWIYIAGDQFTR